MALAAQGDTWGIPGPTFLLWYVAPSSRWRSSAGSTAASCSPARATPHVHDARAAADRVPQRRRQARRLRLARRPARGRRDRQRAGQDPRSERPDARRRHPARHRRLQRRRPAHPRPRGPDRPWVRSALDQLRAGLETNGLAVSPSRRRTARSWAFAGLVPARPRRRPAASPASPTTSRSASSSSPCSRRHPDDPAGRAAPPGHRRGPPRHGRPAPQHDYLSPGSRRPTRPTARPARRWAWRCTAAPRSTRWTRPSPRRRRCSGSPRPVARAAGPAPAAPAAAAPRAAAVRRSCGGGGGGGAAAEAGAAGDDPAEAATTAWGSAGGPRSPGTSPSLPGLRFAEVVAESVHAHARAARAASPTCATAASPSSRTASSCRSAARSRSSRPASPTWPRSPERLGAPLVSEHIAFVRAGGVEAGHLLPVPRSREAVDAVVANVRRTQAELDVPIALEPIAALFDWPDDELDEGAFLTEILDRTGALLLLDVANVYANARNRGTDPAALLDRLPLERIAYCHVAGGAEHDGRLPRHAHRRGAPGGPRPRRRALRPAPPAGADAGTRRRLPAGRRPDRRTGRDRRRVRLPGDHVSLARRPAGRPGGGADRRAPPYPPASTPGWSRSRGSPCCASAPVRSRGSGPTWPRPSATRWQRRMGRLGRDPPDRRLPARRLGPRPRPRPARRTTPGRRRRTRRP